MQQPAAPGGVAVTLSDVPPTRSARAPDGGWFDRRGVFPLHSSKVVTSERRLPAAKTDDHVRRLKMLENDIAEMSGEAVLLEAIALDRAQEDKVTARFEPDRDEAYREFIDK